MFVEGGGEWHATCTGKQAALGISMQETHCQRFLSVAGIYNKQQAHGTSGTNP